MASVAFGVAAPLWAARPARVGVTRSVGRGGATPTPTRRPPPSLRPLSMAAGDGGGGDADHPPPPPAPPSGGRGWAGLAAASIAAAAAAAVVALPPAGAARAASRRGGGSVDAATAAAAVDPAVASAWARPAAAGAVTAVAVPADAAAAGAAAADAAAATPVRRATVAAPGTRGAAPPAGTPAATSRAFLDRISSVPVFLITSSAGQPFLATADASDARVALIFFSPADADGMAASIRASGADAVVYVLGLDKAYEMVKAPPVPSGLPPPAEGGVSPQMVFRFCPDGRQVRAAEAIRKSAAAAGGGDRGGGGGKRGAAARAAKVAPVEGVPVFVAKGLTLRRGGAATGGAAGAGGGGGASAPGGTGGLMVPLFLTREDVDDAWAKLREREAGLPAQATVEVGSLMYLLQEMEANGAAAGEVALGVFPPRESIDYVAKLQAAAAAGG